MEKATNAPEHQLKKGLDWITQYDGVKRPTHYDGVFFERYMDLSGSATIKFYTLKDSFMCPWANLYKYLI